MAPKRVEFSRSRTDRSGLIWNLACTRSFWRWTRIHQWKSDPLPNSYLCFENLRSPKSRSCVATTKHTPTTIENTSTVKIKRENQVCRSYNASQPSRCAHLRDHHHTSPAQKARPLGTPIRIFFEHAKFSKQSNKTARRNHNKSNQFWPIYNRILPHQAPFRTMIKKWDPYGRNLKNFGWNLRFCAIFQGCNENGRICAHMGPIF